MTAVFVPARHAQHHPSLDYSDGLPPFPHLERPDRVEAVLTGIKAATPAEVRMVDGRAEALARSLHDADYLDFLAALCASLKPGEEHIPPVFGESVRAAPLKFRGGAFTREIGTPIGPGTFDAALNALATAEAAATLVAAERASAVALCRPPGHHAGRRRYGGYGFMNNAYGAAEALRQAGASACVLDIDYHLGDGSIEFASAQTPYYSLHCDPGRNYPYLSTLGAIDVAGVIRTATVPEGCGIESYLELLGGLTAEIAARGFEVMVLSLGFDLLAGDYVQDEETRIGAEDFEAIGRLIGARRGPILTVLEGGYHDNELTIAAAAFFRGLRAAA